LIDAGDVGRHEVRRELNATKFESKAEAQTSNQESLRRSRDSLQQNMATSDERSHGVTNSRLLTQDDAPQRRNQIVGRLALPRDVANCSYGFRSSHTSSTALAACSTPSPL
jgi:hypothetical protein